MLEQRRDVGELDGVDDGVDVVDEAVAALAAFAKVLPLTHALALMRYGLVDGHGTGLHDIWGMTDPTAMAALSLAVVVAYAGALSALSVRVFSRAAVR